MKRCVLAVSVCFLLTWLISSQAMSQETNFQRGDGNDDGRYDISDAVHLLGFLFLGGDGPGCKDAADSDDSGVLNITDAIYSLGNLFLGGPPPPSPGNLGCGPDPSEDTLDCMSYLPCS